MSDIRSDLTDINNNVNVGGSAGDNIFITDFGGNDTYTILAGLAGNVRITDNDASTINMPTGLTIDAISFAAAGVQFTVNGFTVTILGDPANFNFVFGGTPLDPTLGTPRTYDEMAASFGTTVPAVGAASTTGTPGDVNSDGTVGTNSGGGTGSTFTLTTNADQIISTSGDDIVDGSLSDSLNATDVIVDQTSADNDILNVTLTATNGTSVVSGIETINVSWDSFSAAAFNATSITGATINLDTTKSVHNSGTTVTGLGANLLTTGSVMTGDLTVNDATSGSINGGAFTTVDVSANDTTTTDVGIATTVIANSATTINVNGATTDTTLVAANTADITIGTDVTVNIDDIATVILTASAAATATLTGTTDVTSLEVKGAVDTVIAAAELLTAVTVIDSTTAGTLRADIGNQAIVDASNWADTIAIKATDTGLNTLTTVTGASVELDVDDTIAINGVTTSASTNTVNVAMDTDMTSVTLGSVATSAMTMNAKNTAGIASAKTLGTLDVGTADVSMAVVGATNAVTSDTIVDLTISTLTAGTKAFTLTGTGDVTLATPTVKTLDASGLTGELVITNFINTTADSIVKGASGTNNVIFDTSTGDVTYTGQNGVNTISASAIAGTSATEGVVSMTTGSGNDALTGSVVSGTDFAKWIINSGAGDDTFTLTTATTNNTLDLDMGEGNDTVTADSITTSSLEAILGAGNDSVSAAALTTGTLDITLGNGDDTVTVGGAATLTTLANIVVDMSGDGTDRVIIAEDTTLDAGVNIILTGGGTGSDTLAFTATDVDVSAATLSLTNSSSTVIETAAGSELIFSVAQLHDKSYTLTSAASGSGEFTVTDATGDNITVDLSKLSMTDSATSGIAIIDINTGSGNDVITGSNISTTVDTIIAGAGTDTIFGQAGADSITGGADADIIDGGAGVDTIVQAGTDSGVATAGSTSTNTAAMDIITYAAGDIIDITAAIDTEIGYDAFTTINDGSTINLTIAANASNDGTVSQITGIYDAASNTFTSTAEASMNAIMISYDGAANDAAVVATQSIILTGVTADLENSAITDGVITLA